ncbi:MAG: DUF1549 and DUF1553 domain-containing protein [Verrucomicrobia subdivision 3 bacterium]|nr:DUF1549 and DUF1553 domain-containing protein [Limisphaerales bacterium]
MKSRFGFQLGSLGLAAGLPVLAAAGNPIGKEIPASPPPLPAIRSLKVEPSSLTLMNGRDHRRVLVMGKTEAGKLVDVTSLASLKSESPRVGIDPAGYIHGREKGDAEIIVTAAGKQTKLPVKVEDASMPPVRFVRDIEPVLSKSGCNAGTCHGSAKGKNGFKLSLRGYDPQFDYQALINDLSGRRFNRVNVDESLMLLKPTAEVPHEGRQVIKPKSREYDLIRQWIAEGAAYEDPAKGRAKEIEILPAEVEMDLPGRAQQLLVIAHYEEGTTRDVTREAVFESNNSDVAEIKENVIKSVRRGEAAILIRYEGLYAARQVTVMGDRTGFEWVEVPEHNYIDKHVHAKLRKMKILPSDVCSDAEFIRRVHLDLTGLPPTVERTHAFIEDEADNRKKRQRLADELIGSKDFVKRWANKWADLLQCNSENLGQKGMWVFRDWIERCVAENKPYDKMVRELLTAEGSCYQNPAVNYLRVLREPGKITEDVSQTFLGVRFNCNKCHDHPFERWTQNQYYEFGAYFAQVSIKRGFLGKEVIRNNTGDATPVTGEEIIYRSYAGGEVKHPKTDMAVAPKVPFGSANGASGDRREPFVDWLTSKENPLFAKSMANRIWSYFLGKGIIDPVDDIRASNPPSNPELLDALTDEFLNSGFNVRKLMHSICDSRTYQLSIAPNKWNEDDRNNFSHALPRRLSAEQMYDAVMIATGVRPNFNGLPQGMTAAAVPDGKVAGDDFLSLFGRPKRMSACECERTSNITLSHALNMINGVTISDAINKADNKIAKLVAASDDDKEVIEGIYLSCLNRLPSEKEVAAIDLSKGPRLEVAQDLAWALINSPAFLFNR